MPPPPPQVLVVQVTLALMVVGSQDGSDDYPRRRSSAGATPPPTSSFPFFFPSSSFFRSRVWSCNAKASAIGALSPTLFSSSQTPDARLRAAIMAPPKFCSPGLHLELLHDPSWKTHIHFYLFPILVLAHIPLQTFLDFNASFILVQ